MKAHHYRQGTALEWFTPMDILAAARKGMGGIDLDPATNEHNHAHAKRFYTVEMNGLYLPWIGRVWLNAPFGIGFAAWMHKANAEFNAGRASQITCLIPVRTNAGWFQAFGNGTREVSLCFPRSIKFIDGRTMQQSKTAAMMPNLIVYLGHRHTEFAEAFRRFGMVAKRVPDHVLKVGKDGNVRRAKMPMGSCVIAQPRREGEFNYEGGNDV